MPGGLGGTSLNQINERLSASLARFQPKIANNVKTRNVTLDWLMGNAKEKRMDRRKYYDGGTEVAVRFRYKKMAKLGEAGNNVGVYSYYDKLNTSPSDTVKTGAERWSNLNVPISISHQEIDENTGQNQFDRLKEKTEEAMDICSETVNDIAWGVAGGDQSKLPTSIPQIVSGSDAGNIHGFSKASNTWLYSQESTNIGDAADNLLEQMTHGYNLTVDNSPSDSDHVDIFLMALAPFEVLQNILPAYVQYGSNKDVDIGFPSLIYMNQPVRFDSTIPLDASGKYQAYALMGKYWELAILKSKNFKTTKFYDMLPDQAADVAQLFLTMAIVCNNPRTNWRGTGITV